MIYVYDIFYVIMESFIRIKLFSLNHWCREANYVGERYNQSVKCQCLLTVVVLLVNDFLKN